MFPVYEQIYIEKVYIFDSVRFTNLTFFSYFLQKNAIYSVFFTLY